MVLARPPAQAQRLSARVLVDGTGYGRLLRLEAPISFWGGIDPASGLVCDPRHPQHGCSVSGRMLVVTATRGSSSSSAVLLELLYAGLAPSALLVAEADAILALGIIAAREMGWTTIPMLQLERPALARLPADGQAWVERGGRVSVWTERA